jgi:hypothetical protein
MRGVTVIRTAGLLAVMLCVVPRTGSAQEPPPTQPPVTPAATPAPQPAPAAVAAAPLTLEEVRARRDAIGIMEGVLAKAVKQGADDVVRRIQSVQPGLTFLTGYAKARGFILEDYGVVFHVEIPGVRPSVGALLEQAERQRSALPRAERAGGTDPVFDPNEAYTEAVKNTLIDKMLTYSIGLDLRGDEWLTIVARDGDEPSTGAFYESITMVIRVRGSDLADFHAKRLNREEVLKRVRVRGF